MRRIEKRKLVKGIEKNRIEAKYKSGSIFLLSQETFFPSSSRYLN